MIINILLALVAIVYGYITDNWWLSAAGLLASVLIGDRLFLVVIVLVAIIGYSCVYYLWLDIMHYPQNQETLAITVSYMIVALIRGMKAFFLGG